MITQADVDKWLARNPQLKVEDKTRSKPCRQRDKPVRANALEPKAQGTAHSLQRPVVRFTVYRVRLYDTDNCPRGIKDLCDGLRYAQLISDDDAKAIKHLPPRQVKVKRKSQERTEIEITYEDSPPACSS